MIEQIQKEIDEMNEEFAKTLAAYREKMQDLFKDGLLKFTESFPKLESFSWQQGTSSFCDGEPCYFTVDEIHALEYDGEEYDGWFGCHTQEEIDKYNWLNDDDLCDDKTLEVKVIVDTINEFIQSASDILQSVYGDATEITVTKDGVTVQEMSCYGC